MLHKEATYNPIYQLSIGKQVFLHLLPGFLVTLVYIFLAKYFHTHGLPSIFGFFVASLLILFPLEIGLPILIERRKNAKVSLKDIFTFREKVPGWELVLLVLGTLLWAAMVFLVGESALIKPFRDQLFGWVPEWFEFGYFLINKQAFSRTTLITTWALGIIFGGIVGPTIEELFFRGYLLPRMAGLKAYAPLVGGVLMCLYHFWSPWLFVIRLIAILPMVYAVWWKKNIYISIFAHCLLNLIGDSLLAIPLVFS